ncbi:MAG: helix-turn-helix domain-containing protein [Phycisphaerae bacterium]|nr:helix-turn-helix domain-containing protein [Phycisphaerae bacterium]
MKSRGKSFVYIHTPAQWRALTSPVRVEMLEVLRRLGPMPLAEIARRLDRPADGLYHHARVLAGAGVVRVRRREGRGRPEAVLELAGREIRVDLSTKVPARRSRLLRMLSSLHRGSFRSLIAAYRAGRLNNPPTNWNYRWEVGWLSSRAYSLVLRHFDAILQILDRGRADPSSQLSHVQILARPVVRRRGAKARLQTRTATGESG